MGKFKAYLKGTALVVAFAGQALLGTSVAWAESDAANFTRGIQPKEPQAVKITARESAAASTDERKILPALRGVVVVAKPSDVKPKGTSGAGVKVEDAVVPPEVIAAIQTYIGAPVSLASLDRMTRDMVLAYRASGNPVVNVVIPPQDSTNGVIQILAVVGRLGTLSVKGNVKDPGYYTEGFPLKSGDVITEAAVVDQLRWKNRRANRHVDAVYAPGSSFGLTNVEFDAKDTKPLHFFVGADNTGTGALGYMRFYTGFIGDNFLGFDNEISYQYTTSELGPTALSANAASYVMPVARRTDFQLSGSYVTTNAASGGGASSQGTLWGLTPQFNTQLPRLGNIGLDAHYGFDYKNSNTNVLFGGATATTTPTEVAQFYAQLLGQRSDSRSSTRFDAGVWASPGNLFATNTDAAFNGARANSIAEYVYGRADLDQTFFLPKDFMFEAKVSGQLTGARLNPSEMMYLGGMNTVRGFFENSIRGDNGILGRFQLFSPAFSFAKDKEDALRAIAFFDAGTVGVNNAAATEASQGTLAGAGVGLTYQFSQNITADLAYGFRVYTDPQVTDGATGAVHFKIMARF